MEYWNLRVSERDEACDGDVDRTSSSVSEFFGENKAEEGHGRASLRGGAVAIVARSLNALVQIASILFLARLLSPEDYGLVGMVTALTGFATIFVDLGTRDAVVQRAHITEGEVNALFWIVLGVGCWALGLYNA